jgi:4-alpha-glucanotransferase
MKFERSAGILLHPTSLPGIYGIGDLGPAAYTFIDLLKETGCKLWQVLPLGPTGFGDSPYQSFSAFAGNPLLISPELLKNEGLLNIQDLPKLIHTSEERIDFGEIIPWKNDLLDKAFINYCKIKNSIHKDYDSFCEENTFWLNEYAIFMTLKELHGGESWINWPKLIKSNDINTINNLRVKESFSIEKYKFVQYIFFKQWSSLKSYANKAGIKIIGDIPLYVAHDSADTWSHQDLFQLDGNGKPSVVAGVPPDYFSPTGQLWGNPIYRWEEHKLTGYEWWMERIKSQLNLVDLVRLDHFRGFAGYWEVPGGELTAENGKWVQGPGMEFFQAIIQRLIKGSQLPFIAEDLGEITQDVIELRDELNLPGMKIMQFAFSSPDNIFLPHNYTDNYVAYTGTHDNDTTIGWFNSAPENEKKFAKEYLGVEGINISWDLIRAIWSSVAVYAIAPMQDILNLDSYARMNYPSRLGGNWSWRMANYPVDMEIIKRLKKINQIYGRG